MLYRARDMANPWSDLEGRSGHYYDSKRLEVGEALRGVFVDMGLGLDHYFGLYRICTIECPEDGIRHTLWLFHADLRRRFQEKKPFLGDHLTIRRLENAGSRTRYRLAVNGTPAVLVKPANRGS